MYTIKIHKKAVKFLKSRTPLEKKIIREKLEYLKENPFVHPQLDIKKMKGEDNLLRLRIGRIRILYQVVEGELLILVISAGARGDVYKKK